MQSKKSKMVGKYLGLLLLYHLGFFYIVYGGEGLQFSFIADTFVINSLHDTPFCPRQKDFFV